MVRKNIFLIGMAIFGIAVAFAQGTSSSLNLVILNSDKQSSMNAYLNTLTGSLVPKESSYLLSHGKYWQGIEVKTSPDATKQAATSSGSWKAMGLSPSTGGLITSRIDTYDDPKGKGYTVTLTISQSGSTCTKIINVGPLTGMAHGWSCPDVPQHTASGSTH